jgi:hypothetical protein
MMYKLIGGDRKEYGPVSADEVRGWINEGRLNGQSMAWVEGSSEWRPLSSFPEFAEALRVQAGSVVLPAGAPMPPANAELWTSHILAREPRLQPLECLRLSWNLLKSHFGLLFTASFIIWLIVTICSFNIFTYLLSWALQGVLYGGLCLIFLRTIRGQPASVGDVFAGFTIAFVHLVLAGFLSSFLSRLAFCCCFLLPGIYLFVAWLFSVPLVADRRLEFWSAMELSRKVVSRVWFDAFALAVLAFLPALLTFLLIQFKVVFTTFPEVREIMEAGGGRPDFSRLVPLMQQAEVANRKLDLFLKLIFLFNLPFAAGALMYAYENLFGTRTEGTR